MVPVCGIREFDEIANFRLDMALCRSILIDGNQVLGCGHGRRRCDQADHNWSEEPDVMSQLQCLTFSFVF